MLRELENDRIADGNRSIADKIIKRIHDLEKTVDYNFGRWAWELLQNARDSCIDPGRKVKVRLAKRGNQIVFGHNAGYFTEQDIRGLINQISSKEVAEGEKSTRIGRFGTGFITTHLLSKKLDVEGVLKSRDGSFYQFNFPIDREGSTMSQLAPKIDKTWELFHESVVLIDEPDYFHTYFTYNLTSANQIQTAQKGIEEFVKLIPFVLAFNERFSKITIENEGEIISFERNKEGTRDNIVQIDYTVNNQTQLLELVVFGDSNGTAVAVELDSATNSVKEFKNIPKLFCDFPLVGTEKFHFPTVVNSIHFHPKTERDGIWLKGNEDTEVTENQQLMELAVDLYSELLQFLAERNVQKLYFAVDNQKPEVDERFIDFDWYKTAVYDKVWETIKTTPIVDTEYHGRKAISDGVHIPAYNDKENWMAAWKLAAMMNKESIKIPSNDSLEKWIEVLPKSAKTLDSVTYAQWIKTHFFNIDDLKNRGLQNHVYALDWLNGLYEIIERTMKAVLFDEYAILPNQNGDFKKVRKKSVFNAPIEQLLFKDSIHDVSLLDIQALVHCDWREFLIHKEVALIPMDVSVVTKETISRNITKHFNELSDMWSENQIQAALLLTEWFENNKDLGKELFPELYRKRAELFMRTISDKESLYQVMKSQTPLSTLVDVVHALENDPELLVFIKERQKALKDERERTIVGEYVESLLAEILSDYGFSFKKNVVGSDLIINCQSFSGGEFQIEVKSTRRIGYVSMTDAQARLASEVPDRYALCVVLLEESPITKEQVAANSIFLTTIGSLVHPKLQELNIRDNYEHSVTSEKNGISIMFDSLQSPKFKIRASVWREGIGLAKFIEVIKGLV